LEALAVLGFQGGVGGGFGRVGLAVGGLERGGRVQGDAVGERRVAFKDGEPLTVPDAEGDRGGAAGVAD
jgi:hypothetical protein